MGRNYLEKELHFHGLRILLLHTINYILISQSPTKFCFKRVLFQSLHLGHRQTKEQLFIVVMSLFNLKTICVVLFSCIMNQCFERNVLNNPMIIFVAKYTISTAVMIENPVRSPIVPPISPIMLTKVAALSLVTIKKTGVLNCILMNLKSCLISYSKMYSLNLNCVKHYTSTSFMMEVCNDKLSASICFSHT